MSELKQPNSHLVAAKTNQSQFSTIMMLLKNGDEKDEQTQPYHLNKGNKEPKKTGRPSTMGAKNNSQMGLYDNQSYNVEDLVSD